MASRVNFANLLDLSAWRLTPYQILSLGFAGLILIGALLLTTPMASSDGRGTSFIDALFTATSAVCVTGLVVVDTGTHYSIFGQLIIIGLIQAGGLGIMTMATLMALIMRRRINLKERLLMQEALNQLTVSGVVRLSEYIIKITLLIEFIGGTILAIRWYPEFGLQGIYFGYWHSISSFCNAGFDLFGGYQSLTRYVDDVTVNLVVTTLIILGGIGFSVMYDVWHNRSFHKLSLHSRVVIVATAMLIFVGTVLIFLFEYNNPNTLENLSLQGKILASYFQSVTPRTAGYNTVDIGKMEDATIFLIILLMFIGASPGSTGGGIKTSTASIVIMALWTQIRGGEDVEITKRRIPKSITYKAFVITFLAGALVVLVTMVLCLSEKEPFLNVLFEVTSAFGTVGLTTGITPSLTSTGKLWLILTMFAGRVGPVTLALALAMKTRKVPIQYPEAQITIG